MTASRSVSFVRSSSAPLTRVVPRAPAAATNRIGNSSIASGTSSGGTSMPRSSLWRTNRSATGSAPSRRSDSSSMSAPISRRIVSRPVRVGFTPTFLIRRPSGAPRQRRDDEERGRREVARHADLAAAQRRGTCERRRCALVPARSSRPPRPCSAASARCGRGSGPASGPSCVLPHRAPASRIADFTCALATGSS